MHIHVDWNKYGSIHIVIVAKEFTVNKFCSVLSIEQKFICKAKVHQLTGINTGRSDPGR